MYLANAPQSKGRMHVKARRGSLRVVRERNRKTRYDASGTCFAVTGHIREDCERERLTIDPP